MGLFQKHLNKNTALVGNESTGADLEAGESSALLIATANVADAMSEINEGQIQGLEIEQEMEALDDGAERIQTALTQIANMSIGANAPTALSSESLAVLDATLLQEVGVHSTGNESGSTLGPVEATEEVVLGLESVAGDAWKATKEAFYKFLDWIQGQFNKVFGGFERLRSKAKALKEKESKFDGSVSKDKVKVKFADLVVGKDGTAIGALPTGISDISELATTKITAIEDSADAIVTACEKVLDANATDIKPATEEGVVKVLSEAQVALIDLLKAQNDVTLLGSRTIKSNTDEDNTKPKLELSAPAKAKEDKEVSPLDRGKIGDVCDAVVEACDELINGRKKMKDTKAYKSKFEKLYSAAEKVVKDDDYKDVKDAIRNSGKLAREAGMIANGSFRIKLTGHCAKVMNSALTYADKSLKKA